MELRFLHKYPRLLIPIGFFGGLLLGVIARLWMRWISTTPEFSWGGTLGIVIGFGIFGMAQAGVHIYVSKRHSKLRTNLLRSIGVIFSLQLFMAAGAIMFPTVLTGALSAWRREWAGWLRLALLGISITFAALIIKAEILDEFGLDIVTVGRILLMIGIYACIIRALKATVSKSVRAPAEMS